MDIKNKRGDYLIINFIKLEEKKIVIYKFIINFI